MEPKAKPTPAIEGRVSILEKLGEDLAGDIRELSLLVREQNKQVSTEIQLLSGETRNQIAALSTDISNISRPNWHLLVAGMSIVLVLVGMVGNSYLAPLVVTIQQHTELMKKIDERTEGIAEKNASIEQRISYEARIAEMNARLIDSGLAPDIRPY